MRNKFNKGAFYFFLIVPFCVFSQGNSFSSLGKYQKRWAFFHPFAACKVKAHKKEMFATYKEVKEQKLLDVYENGGKIDAFRHVFAMAYFGKFVSVKKLRKLGVSHEKDNYRQFLEAKPDEEGLLADSLSCIMDLKNNDLGLSLIKELKRSSVEEIKNRVLKEIKEGKAVIIKRTDQGLYLQCNGQVVPNEILNKQWNIPKCLVPSNSQ